MKKTIVALLLIATPVLAQQQPDPAFLSKALASLQQQRNQALDMQASAEAREAVLKEEVAKLKARIEEMEKAREAKPASPE